jgi:hypothetical protein
MANELDQKSGIVPAETFRDGYARLQAFGEDHLDEIRITELMVVGDQVGRIYSADEAARALGMKWSQRRIRAFMGSPAFANLRATLLLQVRDNVRPKAMRAVIDIIDGKDSAGERRDDGSAAWATSRLKASAALLGETVGVPRPGVAVQINQQFGGYQGTAGRVMTIDDCIAEDEAEERGEVKPAWDGPPRPGYVIKPSKSMVDREKRRRAQQQIEGGAVDAVAAEAVVAAPVAGDRTEQIEAGAVVNVTPNSQDPQD